MTRRLPSPGLKLRLAPLRNVFRSFKTAPEPSPTESFFVGPHGEDSLFQMNFDSPRADGALVVPEAAARSFTSALETDDKHGVGSRSDREVELVEIRDFLRLPVPSPPSPSFSSSFSITTVSPFQDVDLLPFPSTPRFKLASLPSTPVFSSLPSLSPSSSTSSTIDPLDTPIHLSPLSASGGRVYGLRTFSVVDAGEGAREMLEARVRGRRGQMLDFGLQEQLFTPFPSSVFNQTPIAESLLFSPCSPPSSCPPPTSLLFSNPFVPTSTSASHLSPPPLIPLRTSSILLPSVNLAQHNTKATTTSFSLPRSPPSRNLSLLAAPGLRPGAGHRRGSDSSIDSELDTPVFQPIELPSLNSAQCSKEVGLGRADEFSLGDLDGRRLERGYFF